MAPWRPAFLALVGASVLFPASAPSIGLGASPGQPIEVACGPLDAPTEQLCELGHHQAVFTGYSYVLYFGYTFSGEVAIHLHYGVFEFVDHCYAQNGFHGICWQEGIEPRNGVPVDAMCTATGRGQWGCQLDHS